MMPLSRNWAIRSGANQADNAVSVFDGVMGCGAKGVWGTLREKRGAGAG